MSAIAIPEDRTFRSRELRLADVVDEVGQLAEVVFDQCTLVGPGIVFLDGGRMDHCTIDLPLENPEAVLWPMPDAQVVYGCLKITACLFDRCRFHQVGFTGGRAQLAAFREMTRGTT